MYIYIYIIYIYVYIHAYIYNGLYIYVCEKKGLIVKFGGYFLFLHTT